MVINILFYGFAFISLFSFLVSFLFLFIEICSVISDNSYWVSLSYFTSLVSISVWLFSFSVFVFLGGFI